MEGVAAAWDTAGHGNFDGRILRERDDAPFREQILRGVGATQDLQKHRDARRAERDIVDEEATGLEADRIQIRWLKRGEAMFSYRQVQSELKVLREVHAPRERMSRLQISRRQSVIMTVGTLSEINTTKCMKVVMNSQQESSQVDGGPSLPKGQEKSQPWI